MHNDREVRRATLRKIVLAEAKRIVNRGEGVIDGSYKKTKLKYYHQMKAILEKKQICLRDIGTLSMLTDKWFQKFRET